MKYFRNGLQRYWGIILAGAFLILLDGCVPAAENDALQPQQDEAATSGGEHDAGAPPAELITFQNYSSLPELITIVCDDAAKRFSHFYGPQVVWVKPFVYIGESGQKQMTMLGMTLSDQMIAMINNGSLDTSVKGKNPQNLKGVLQEIDGYLRIHISGINAKAVRRSYAVNIEMSESLYRALHTNIGG